ncbi:hypothetical protein [Streptomyces sp. 8ZJF_21]|uniref:hypothetical protein n=1 Tax=Streptomyces sp. 8ZJF_21 TaxID=2903141 RepID=UPI001E35284E|nr:hypothetical protein [Streptomyces sp. 8ZJF_21]MCD9593533.1 hypothetical protein [Streptomyces sp. 8ZJF_21]
MASDDLDIAVPGSGALPPDARAELEICLREFGTDVYDEANRLEVSFHIGSGPPIVTSSLIREAYLYCKRGHIQRPVPVSKHFFDAISYAAAAVAGVFAGRLDTPTGSIGFAASLGIGVIAYFVGRKK